MLANRTEDLLRRHADIAVRMVRPALVARRLGGIEPGLHAHQGCLDRPGMPAGPDELRGRALIGFDRETAFTRGLRAHGLAVHRGMSAPRTNSDQAHLAAIRARYGIGMCQVPPARREARLVRRMSDAVSFRLETWLAMHVGRPRRLHRISRIGRVSHLTRVG